MPEPNATKRTTANPHAVAVWDRPRNSNPGSLKPIGLAGSTAAWMMARMPTP